MGDGHHIVVQGVIKDAAMTFKPELKALAYDIVFNRVHQLRP
jgi:hypothetical protein